MSETAALPAPSRANNFDALRFVFAALVILNHSFVVLDGGEGRDPLFRLFHGRVDCGALAVDAFFAISGFLITLSWLRKPQWRPFLRARVLRVFPGFLVVFALSIFVVAPLGGAAASALFAPATLAKNIVRALMLSEPACPARSRRCRSRFSIRPCGRSATSSCATWRRRSYCS